MLINILNACWIERGCLFKATRALCVVLVHLERIALGKLPAELLKAVWMGLLLLLLYILHTQRALWATCFVGRLPVHHTGQGCVRLLCLLRITCMCHLCVLGLAAGRILVRLHLVDGRRADLISRRLLWSIIRSGRGSGR